MHVKASGKAYKQNSIQFCYLVPLQPFVYLTLMTDIFMFCCSHYYTFNSYPSVP